MYFAVLRCGAVTDIDWLALFKQSETYIPVGVGTIIVGLVNSLLSPDLKAKIVFSRWNNALPGSRAFSDLGPKDPRVSMIALKNSLGQLPTEPISQNRLWYKLFKSVKDEVEVKSEHREFLFYRDYSIMALMLCIIFSAGALVQAGAVTFFIVFSVIFAQFIFASIAARNHGNRFVTTVLAIKSIEG